MKGASLRDHATRASHRAGSRLGHAAGIVSAVLLLAACDGEQRVSQFETNQALRAELFQTCMKSLPAGPTHTRYNDWDEVVDSCESAAYYQAQTCIAGPCLKAQGTSAFGHDPQGHEAKPAGPVAVGHAPHPHSE